MFRGRYPQGLFSSLMSQQISVLDPVASPSPSCSHHIHIIVSPCDSRPCVTRAFTSAGKYYSASPSRDPPTRCFSRLSRSSGHRLRWFMNQLLTCVMLIPVACKSLATYHEILGASAPDTRENGFLVFAGVWIRNVLHHVSNRGHTRHTVGLARDRTMSS